MKKLVLISFIFCFIAAGALAQETETRTPEERAQIQNEWMKENLQLSEDQIPRVELLNLEYAQKMEEVKKMNGRQEHVSFKLLFYCLVFLINLKTSKADIRNFTHISTFYIIHNSVKK